MGTSVFDNQEELTYNFLNAIELSVLPTGEVVDFTTMAPDHNGRMTPTLIKFGGKTLKATIDPERIQYAGENEVMLDILSNAKQVNALLGVLLDKMQLQGNKLLSFYNQDIDDPSGYRKTSNAAKFEDREVVSAYYFNKCLSMIDLVFNLSENDVDLHNFDAIPE
jgi:hypothetical protein